MSEDTTVTVTIESHGSSMTFVLQGLPSKLHALGTPEPEEAGLWIPWTLDTGWSGNCSHISQKDH